jgi:hypothetical protein
MDPALGVLDQTIPPPVRLVISVPHSDDWPAADRVVAPAGP